MKVMLFVLLISTITAKGQTCGVYMNTSDFRKGKLSYSNDCSAKKHKIKLNDFLEKPYIEVVYNGEPRLLMKNEIFGYKNCDGEVSRFIGNQHYKILNPEERLLIYQRKVQPTKNQPISEFYYFSSSQEDKAEPLTLENLKKAFPENHKFHDLLDAEFDIDKELVEYDSYHKMFKINRLLVSSLQ